MLSGSDTLPVGVEMVSVALLSEAMETGEPNGAVSAEPVNDKVVTPAATASNPNIAKTPLPDAPRGSKVTSSNSTLDVPSTFNPTNVGASKNPRR